MLSQERAVRTARSILILGLVLLPGCVTGPSADPSYEADPSTEVDPTRAWLPLDRIEPLAVRPEGADTIEPLSDRARRQIDRARRLIGEDRFTEAAIELERALRYDPNHPDIHRALAHLHWEAGNLVRARSHAGLAIEARPDDAMARYILGRAHRSSDDAAAALLAFRTALLCSDLDRDVEMAALCHYHLASTLADEGYLAAALAQYEAFDARASLLADSESIGSELGSLLQDDGRVIVTARVALLEKLGRPEEAARLLAPLVADATGDATLGVRYARLLLAAGRSDESLAAARRFRLTDDEVVKVIFEIHQRDGHPERILEDLGSGLAREPDDSRLVLTVAGLLSDAGRPQDAAEALQVFLEDHSENHAVRAALMRALVAQNAWAAVVEVYADGVDRDPSSAVSFEEIARVIASDEDAVARFVRGAVADVTPTGAYVRGVIAHAAGKPADAERWLRACHRQRPEFLPGRVALAEVYVRTYQYDLALEVASRRAADTPEDARLEYVLGETYERLDDARTAEQHFQAAIQLDRSDTRPMFALASLYQASRKRLQAQRQYQVLLKQDPTHEEARERLIATYVEDGKFDVAVAQLEELARTARSPYVRVRCQAFLQQMNQKDLEGYRHLLLETMDQHGPDAQTWLAVAQSFERPEEAEARQNAYRRVLEIDPENEEAALGLVEESRLALDFEEAAERLAELLKRRPNRHAWRLGVNDPRMGPQGRWLGLIGLYWVVQDFDAALAVARGAEGREGLDPDVRARYRRAIVDTLWQADRKEEALAGLEAWSAAAPDDQALALFLANEYVRQDQPTKAIPIVTAIHEASSDSQTLLNVIRALLGAAHYDRATQHLLEWLDQDPENDDALNLLANVLTDAGRVDDALELARSRLLQTLDRERLQTLMIAVLSEAERFEDGLEFVEALMDEVLALLESGGEARFGQREERPNDERLVRLPNEPFTGQSLYERLVQLRDFQIRLLLGTKDYRTAKADLTSWLELARGSQERANYLTQLAFCHQALGDDEEAAKILERTLVLRPDDPAINNDVAYGWIDRGIRMDEAEPMIRRAVAVMPRQGAYLDTFGWLLYKKGEYEEAKKWLTRANHIREGGDAVILDHLGDALWRLGEEKEAVARWEEAAQVGRDRDEDAFVSSDEKRVRDTIDKKIEDARGGRTPKIAPVASGG